MLIEQRVTIWHYSLPLITIESIPSFLLTKFTRNGLSLVDLVQNLNVYYICILSLHMCGCILGCLHLSCQRWTVGFSAMFGPLGGLWWTPSWRGALLFIYRSINILKQLVANWYNCFICTTTSIQRHGMKVSHIFKCVNQEIHGLTCHSPFQFYTRFLLQTPFDLLYPITGLGNRHEENK